MVKQDADRRAGEAADPASAAAVAAAGEEARRKHEERQNPATAAAGRARVEDLDEIKAFNLRVSMARDLVVREKQIALKVRHVRARRNCSSTAAAVAAASTSRGAQLRQ